MNDLDVAPGEVPQAMPPIMGDHALTVAYTGTR